MTQDGIRISLGRPLRDQLGNRPRHHQSVSGLEGEGIVAQPIRVDVKEPSEIVHVVDRGHPAGVAVADVGERGVDQRVEDTLVA